MDFKLESEEHMLEVLDKLQAVRERYGFILLADVMDLLGLPSTYQDQKVGWGPDIMFETFKDNAGHVYALHFPEPTPRPEPQLDTSSNGVWVLYSFDSSAYVISIFADEISALRRMNEQGYGKVEFVSFGVDFQEFINKKKPKE